MWPGETNVFALMMSPLVVGRRLVETVRLANFGVALAGRG